MRRIAVASDDGENIAAHFGRSRFFVIYEINERGSRRCETRPNTFTAHGRGECSHSDTHEHGHGAIVNALQDCDAVICCGMGRRATADLQAAGVKPLFLTRDTDVAGAIEDYLAGRLSDIGGTCPGY